MNRRDSDDDLKNKMESYREKHLSHRVFKKVGIVK